MTLGGRRGCRPGSDAAMDLSAQKSLHISDEDYGDFRALSRSDKREKNIRKKTHPKSTSAINATSTTLHIPKTQATIQLHNLFLPQPSYTYPNESKENTTAKKNKNKTITLEQINRSHKRADRHNGEPPSSTVVDVAAEEERGSWSEEEEEEMLDSETGSNYTYAAPRASRLQGTQSPHHSSFRQQQLLLQRGEDRRVVTVKTAEALGAVNIVSNNCLTSSLGLSRRPHSSSEKLNPTSTSTITSNDQDCFKTSSTTYALCQTCGGSLRHIHASTSSSALESSTLRNDAINGELGRVCSCNRKSLGGQGAAGPADVRRWTQYAVEEGLYERADDARMRELARHELSTPRSMVVRLEEMDRRNRQRRQEEALGRVVEGAVERFEGGFSDGNGGRRKKGWGR